MDPENPVYFSLVVKSEHGNKTITLVPNLKADPGVILENCENRTAGFRT